jgi:hypothetical protein
VFSIPLPRLWDKKKKKKKKKLVGKKIIAHHKAWEILYTKGLETSSYNLRVLQHVEGMQTRMKLAPYEKLFEHFVAVIKQ